MEKEQCGQPHEEGQAVQGLRVSDSHSKSPNMVAMPTPAHHDPVNLKNFTPRGFLGPERSADRKLSKPEHGFEINFMSSKEGLIKDMTGKYDTW